MLRRARAFARARARAALCSRSIRLASDASLLAGEMAEVAGSSNVNLISAKLS